MPPVTSYTAADRSDALVASRIAGYDLTTFEAVLRQHNAKLFRIARVILGNDADAEDALQDAYLAAFRKMTSFRGDSKLSTWLTRIVINQALTQRRSRKGDEPAVALHDQRRDALWASDRETFSEKMESPENATLREQLRRVLERKIDALPLDFRTVFMLREVQELSVEETAACLDIPEPTVRSRLFRARGLLRSALAQEIDIATSDVFRFGGARCDRIVANVLARVRSLSDAELIGNVLPSGCI